MDLKSLSQGQIYSIVTDSSHSLHPGNDAPIRSFEIIRDGLSESVNTWRGSEFTVSDDLTDAAVIAPQPLLIITNAEHDRLVEELLEYAHASPIIKREMGTR